MQTNKVLSFCKAKRFNNTRKGFVAPNLGPKLNFLCSPSTCLHPISIDRLNAFRVQQAPVHPILFVCVCVANQKQTWHDTFWTERTEFVCTNEEMEEANGCLMANCIQSMCVGPDISCFQWWRGDLFPQWRTAQCSCWHWRYLGYVCILTLWSFSHR